MKAHSIISKHIIERHITHHHGFLQRYTSQQERLQQFKLINSTKSQLILYRLYSHLKIRENRKLVSLFSKQIFEKGYKPNWTSELLKVVKIKITDPSICLLGNIKCTLNAWYQITEQVWRNYFTSSSTWIKKAPQTFFPILHKNQSSFATFHQSEAFFHEISDQSYHVIFNYKLGGNWKFFITVV